MEKTSRISKSFQLPNCQKEELPLPKDSKNHEEDSLPIKQDEKLFRIINSRTVLKDIDIKACIPIVNVYFEQDKMYIYIVNGSKIVRNAIITSDSKENSDKIIIDNKLVRFCLVRIINLSFSLLSVLRLFQRESM